MLTSFLKRNAKGPPFLHEDTGGSILWKGMLENLRK